MKIELTLLEYSFWNRYYTLIKPTQMHFEFMQRKL